MENSGEASFDIQLGKEKVETQQGYLETTLYCESELYS